jgi:D-beta-D-heptose 7-phosphate kinase/D-beta-D-heptose 1-phosphate adenosyltransferase
MSCQEMLRAIPRFRKLRVLVVGDLFLDEYIESEMFEISKEGPMPVLRFESKTQVAGAAGNLASTIRGLGAAVSLVALVGRDPNGEVLLDQLRRKGLRTGGIYTDPNQATLTYTKIRARVSSAPSREIMRMDVLPDGPLDDRREKRILASLEREIRWAQGIVVLDQIHHLITPRILREVVRLARKRGIPVQGSSRNHIGSFRGFDLITPNDVEALGAVGGSRRNIALLGERLREQGRHRQVILTLGPDGMALFPTGGGLTRLPTFAREVVDVTGAGDCVSAVAVLGNILGWNLVSIGWAASCAAAVVIARVGTYHLSAADLAEAIRAREKLDLEAP